ncbi:hypothetical protein BKA02_002149 [Microbacterium pseudoresistens]|uniref:YlxR domain-containing protein n=1 Tax=Microbacterium pseudoresistens TaxID=640634 RepID=A0A7Y9EW77_9MICO|nr:hypothetical protein [Microbacterium pseudoresistens]
MVVQNELLVFDEKAVMPGRGAWVHPTSDCVDTARRRRAFTRALRVPASVDFAESDIQTIEKRLNGYGNKVNGSK